MENLWKNIKVRIYEPDYYCNELYGEDSNYEEIGDIQFPIHGEDTEFNRRQVYYALLANHFIEEEDWDLDEFIFDEDMEIGEIFLYAMGATGKKEVVFRLQVRE